MDQSSQSSSTRFLHSQFKPIYAQPVHHGVQARSDAAAFAVPARPSSRQYLAQDWSAVDSMVHRATYQDYDANFELGPVDVDPRTIASLPIDTLTKHLDAQPWHAANYQANVQSWPSTNSQAMYMLEKPYADGLDDQLSLREGSELQVDSGYGSQQPQERKFSLYDTPRVARKRSGANKSRTSRASSLYDASEDASQTNTNGKRRSSSVQIAPCPICEKQLNSKSDATKHAKTHERPYKCKADGCRYFTEGFGTPNDAARHMATKHQMYEPGVTITGFVCTLCLPSVNAREKWWPRQDNFKAHLKRKHAGVDYARTIEQSTRHIRPDDAETVISGAQTNYPALSHADSDRYYQDDYGPASSQQPMSRQLTHLGESTSWFRSSDAHAAAEELIGVGADFALMSDRPYVGPYGANGDDVEPVLAEQRFLSAVIDHSAVNEGLASTQYSTFEQSNPRKRRRVEEPLHEVAEDWQAPLKCETCGKNNDRRCDARKHEARHTRRYGCTEPQCYDRHGSKSDWLRHEDRLHRLPETWLCRLLTGGSRSFCNHFCRERDDFIEHLEEAHAIKDKEGLETIADKMHLPRGGRLRFWCGYCQEVMDNPDKYNAWSARCHHVGKHMDLSGNFTIEQWMCPELQKPKGVVTDEEKRSIRDPPFKQRRQPVPKEYTEAELELLTMPRTKLRSR